MLEGTNIPVPKIEGVAAEHREAATAIARAIAKGAYRADLGRHGPTGLTLHKVFEVIRAEGGEAGLRRFFDQVCSADGDHCAALERAGLLLNGDLALEEKRRRHFPQWRESVA